VKHKEIELISATAYTRVLTPIKREKRIIQDPIIIGFDTEFIVSGDTQRLLSIQFSTQGYSKIYLTTNRSCESDQLSNKYPLSFLTEHIYRFLQDVGLDENKDTIYLISHYAHAEMANFIISGDSDIKLKQISKGLNVEYKTRYPLGGKEIKIKVIDLYCLLEESLEKIGSYFDIPKLSLDEVGGKSGFYWKEHMGELLLNHPDVFKQYALRDAEIAYHAYSSLRDNFIEDYKVDLLDFPTFPSIAGYIFRRDRLYDPIAKTKTIIEPRSQGRILESGDKTYDTVLQKRDIYDGDLNVRQISMLAYHGGRIETYCRGRIEHSSLIYYDVDSLYPSSSMLQPLPIDSTRWVKYSKRDSEKFINEAEGFVEVEFTFPDDTLYPSLPVDGLRDGILYFPLNGTSYCTLSELRMAIKLGLQDFTIKSGYGFYPRKCEREHPLRDFMNDLLEKKRRLERESIEYMSCKSMMNMLVGKLTQRGQDKNNYKRVGNLWSPEWASLVLGKSRSLMAEFVAKGSYFISNDSVLLPRDVDINCDSLDELRSVGSDLREEYQVDHGVIIRARLYALNPLSNDPDSRHFARHAVSCQGKRYIEIIRDGYDNRDLPDLSFTSTKLVRYNKSISTGKNLNSTEIKESTIETKWDGKRRLFKEVDNPFRNFSWSRPLTYDEINNNEMRKPPKSKPGRKAGKKLETQKKSDITRLFIVGMKRCDIAKELGVSKGYVSKVCKEIREQEDVMNV
jgi:DNA polymerase family B